MVDVLSETSGLLAEMYEKFNGTPWGDKYLSDIRSLQGEMNAPCVLAIAGKVKSGKSFLVNALLGIDLAMTGNTETTATINVFKKGKPISPETPVLCQWIDGRKEWKPKVFLDSLKGTDEETLKQTAMIDKLIFFIEDNPLLEDVTLVDTPGIGADVGKDGDDHQRQTETYFKLRNRHESETKSLTNNADAVIYLFNTVPTETDKRFISSLHDGGKGLTALNGIGVLSKIDRDLQQLNNVEKFANGFEKEFFTIVPTSAAISRYMPDREKAIYWKKELQEGFESEKGFDYAITGTEEQFVTDDDLPDCLLSIERRKKLLKSFAQSDLPWSAFGLIASELYKNSDVDKALKKLSTISGIEPLKKLINNHFFQRSRQLRCNRVLTDVMHILMDIQYSNYFLTAELEANFKEGCLAECRKMVDPYKTLVERLITKYVDDLQKVKSSKETLLSFKSRVEKLKSELADIDNCYLAYQMLISNREHFSESDFSELSILFTGQEIIENPLLKQQYWAGIANLAIANSIEQRIAHAAERMYNKINVMQ